MRNVSKHQLLAEYNALEVERQKIKHAWCDLKNKKADNEQIKILGKKLTELTFNQAHIIIDMQRIDNETN